MYGSGYEVVKWTPEEVATRAANNVAKLEATALLHQNHLSVLRSFLQSGKVESQSLSDICPTLLAIKSKFKGMSRIPESPDPSRVSDRKWATDTVSEPLSEAMLAFSRHDYDEASDRLLEITRSPILNRLGGSVAQRDIVKQTLIGTHSFKYECIQSNYYEKERGGEMIPSFLIYLFSLFLPSFLPYLLTYSLTHLLTYLLTYLLSSFLLQRVL